MLVAPEKFNLLMPQKTSSFRLPVIGYASLLKLVNLNNTTRFVHGHFRPSSLEIVECVTTGHVAACKTNFEPLHPLCRTAMGK